MKRALALVAVAAVLLTGCRGLDSEIEDVKREKQFIDDCVVAGGEIWRDVWGAAHCGLPDDYDGKDR